MPIVFVLTTQARRLSDEDGGIILNLKNGKYYSLNEVGDKICDSLRTSVDLEGLVGNVAEQYLCPPEVVRADVEAFVQQLIACGLVEVR